MAKMNIKTEMAERFIFSSDGEISLAIGAIAYFTSYLILKIHHYSKGELK